MVERESPAVLALELPPLAVPLYEHHASDAMTPPTFGGEMSAAIQAADGAAIVGIDGPSPSFLRRVVAALHRERASLETVRRTAQSVLSLTKTALTRRLAATLATLTAVQVTVDVPTVYDAGWGDDAERQATDERERMETAEAMRSAFDPPPPAAVRTTARERHMADRLATLRSRGDVVAVVGQGHGDAVAARLAD
ncbi:hypothetical protein EGH21_04445 [Halomicroarcula sp. F13]|uniref:Conjugal transfer protein TraB n=1 Tax=Haloarcula rubra TaxID=2487747 RepID=A0AAW4PMD4_9EURY|nr:hypothetical protein [Halomicroarcula rubra]MBX0322281.1 hypothetical protein [Halomicroarcula rubra]